VVNPALRLRQRRRVCPAKGLLQGSRAFSLATARHRG
jgi:hypothetical protein